MSRRRLGRLEGWPANGEKLLIGMIHLKGDSPQQVLDLARTECERYLAGGMDGVVVENYFGTIDDVRTALPLLSREFPELLVGVDIIWANDKSFDLALEFDLPFIQLDSAAGHLDPKDEPAFDQRIADFRSRTDAVIFGGVRFKNQPYLSGNDVATDLRIAMRRCEAVIVTSDATGVETEMSKIREFREVLGDFPLLVGAGVDEKNCVEQLSVADGAIIGSSLKTGGVASGDVELERVSRLVKRVREELS